MNEKSKVVFSISAIIMGLLVMIECVFLFNEYKLYIPILAMVFACLISIICVLSIQRKKETLFKITFIVLVFGGIALALFIGLLKTGMLELLSSDTGLADMINKAGIWGPIVYIFIQFLQVTFVPIPSTITIIAGMAVFKSLPLVLVCSTIGMISGSMFAFFLGRMFGVKLIVWMVGSKSFNKYQKLLKGRDKMMLFLMFLFPVFPDDLLCMFAGVMTMSYGTFFVMQLITRPIGITVTSLTVEIVELIPMDTWWGMMIWAFVAVGMCVLMFCVWRYSSKLEKYMVGIISKHFGTNEITATIDRAQVRNEVQNLISDTIIEGDSDSSIDMVNTKPRYKAKRYFVNYKD